MLGSLIALAIAPASGLAPLVSLTTLGSLALLEPEPLPLSARTSSTATASLSAEWLEMSTTATSAPAVVVAPPEPVAPPTSARVRLVYTGGTGGIGSGRYDFDVARELAALAMDAKGQVLEASPYHGALAQGLHVLIPSDRRIGTSLAFLAAEKKSCRDPVPARSIRTAKARLLIEGNAVPSWVQKLGGTVVVAAYELTECTSADGVSVRLYGPAGSRLDVARLALPYFEMRTSLHLSTTLSRDVEVIGVPVDEPARRIRELRALAAEGDVLYLDTGSFLDGTSTIIDGELSQHRALGLEILHRLAPRALSLGETELAGGAKNLLSEMRAFSLPYVATNWTSEAPELALPKVIYVSVPTPIGPVKIAFLGVIDPSLSSSLPFLANEGIKLEEPLKSLEEEVARIHSSTAAPDLLVVLTSARWEIYEAIQSEVRGIDLVIGETSPIENRTLATEVVVSPTTSRHRASAGILPIIGATVADLDLARAPNGRLMLEKVRIESRRMTERLEPDPEVLARVSETRARLYPPLDRVLVRPPGNAAERVSNSLWSRLVCEAVRRYTDADVVLLPELPRVLDILGPQTELLALNGLGVFDKLERHTVRGRKLADVLQDAPRVAPVSCGGQTGIRRPLVLGRGIEDARVYTVVSTDRVRINGLGAMIGADGYGTRLFDVGTFEPLTDDGGAAISLRTAVLTELRRLRDEGGESAPISLSTPSETTRADSVYFRVHRLSLLFASFLGPQEDALPEVKDARANAPSALTLGGDLDLQLVFEQSWTTTDVRVRAQYNSVQIDDTDPLEQADDIRLSTSVGLPVWRFAVGPLQAMPFAEVLFDSEFTPLDDMTRRQAALFVTGGLALSLAPYLTALRIGGAATRDFSTDVPVGFVLRTDAEANFAFGYDLAGKLLLDGSWFRPTDGDNASTLRFRYALEARLALPLARWLAIGGYAKAFIFQGAGKDLTAASYDLGFLLDISGAFAL